MTSEQLVHYVCDRCGKRIGRHGRCLVTMEVRSADDPEIDKEELERDHAREIETLLRRMEEMDTSEIEDGVYQKRFYDLCAACAKAFAKAGLSRPNGDDS